MAASKRNLEIVLELKDAASADLKKFQTQVSLSEKETNRWDGAIQTAKRSLIALGAASAGFIGYGVKIAADLQTAEVGLTTLLGSADKAAATLARLKIEAARTPFELPGLTQATQLLTSVTKDGDRSIDILLDVGEALAAMGKGQAELDRIIVNLQQIAATGKAATIDIKQFAFAGIPIYEMLAETTGKSGEALGDLIAEGGVTFDLLTQMFDEANDAGGRFFGAFENQSGTFNQALSNMKDSLGIFAADLATNLGVLDGLTDAMMAVASVVGNYETVFANARERVAAFFQEVDDRTGLITHLRLAFMSVVETFNTFLRPALEELMEALRPLKPFGEALAVVFGTGLVVALHILIAALNVAAQALTIILTGFTRLATFIANTFTFSIEYLAGIIRMVSSVFKGDWVSAIDVVQNAIANLVDWVEKLIDRLANAIDLAREIGGGALKFVSRLLPGRASGGTVTANQPYMVGERGPELFVPNASGGIVPNHRLGGGSTTVVNINGGTYLSEDAAEEIGDTIIRKLGMTTKLA